MTENRNRKDESELAERNEILLKCGLYGIKYRDTVEGINEYSVEYPYHKYDKEKSITRWYKKVAFTVTDEEFEEIKKYYEENIHKEQNTNTEGELISNIGGKIKGLATAKCWIGIIIYVILSMVFFSQGYYNDTSNIMGIIFLIGGPIISWFSSWILYGFGELIENTSALKDIIKKN